MYFSDKIIISSDQLQDLIETARRRQEIVTWLVQQYENFIDLAEQWSWHDATQNQEYFEAAQYCRAMAEQIGDVSLISDHTVNLIYLGEIEL
jgi:hypothetical protein